MPWWAWLIFAVVGLVTLMFLAALRFRGRVRSEFVAYLKARRPKAEVGEVNATFGQFRLGANRDWTTLNFLDVYQAAAEMRAINPADREPIYERAIEVMERGSTVVGPEAGEVDELQVLPRLVGADFFDGPPEKSRVPHVALGEVGLYVVFAVEGAGAVFVTREHQVRMQMSDAELLERALANLRGRSPDLGAAVRRVVEGGEAGVIKHFDGHDAARVLLVPEHLREGEALVAAVPDRETLALARVPADGAYESLAPMVMTTSDRRVYGGLLRVTAEGIEGQPRSGGRE